MRAATAAGARKASLNAVVQTLNTGTVSRSDGWPCACQPHKHPMHYYIASRTLRVVFPFAALCCYTTLLVLVAIIPHLLLAFRSILRNHPSRHIASVEIPRCSPPFPSPTALCSSSPASKSTPYFTLISKCLKQNPSPRRLPPRPKRLIFLTSRSACPSTPHGPSSSQTAQNTLFDRTAGRSKDCALPSLTVIRWTWPSTGTSTASKMARYRHRHSACLSSIWPTRSVQEVTGNPAYLLPKNALPEEVISFTRW